jgi:5-methylcytosine-specific restriction endonuclease McrA
MTCETCGKVMRLSTYGPRSKRFCSKRCCGLSHPRRNPSYQAMPRTGRTCLQCGAGYEGTRGRKFCSDNCATRYHRRADRDRRAASRKTTSPAQLIYRRRIFERDGWLCGICATPVDPTLPATHDFGATLDHIVPLARGGQHVESNVQLAHWLCNRLKGAGTRAA